MGYRTLDGVWRALPTSDLQPAHRLVLLALAQAARDDTGRCWPGMDWLTASTGLSRTSVKRALRRLEADSRITRHARARGADGRPVFATRSRRTTYTIVDRTPVDNDPEGGHQRPPSTSTKGLTSGPLSAEKGGHLGPERGPLAAPLYVQESFSRSTRARETSTPSPAQAQTSEAEAIVARRLRCPPAEAAGIVADVIGRHRPVRPAAYINALPDADLAALAKTRQATVAATAERAWRTEYQTRRAAAGVCPHGAADFTHPVTDEPACPLCRASGPAGGLDHPPPTPVPGDPAAGPPVACRVCGCGLDPVLTEDGWRTHPGCDPDAEPADVEEAQR